MERVIKKEKELLMMQAVFIYLCIKVHLKTSNPNEEFFINPKNDPLINRTHFLPFLVTIAQFQESERKKLMTLFRYNFIPLKHGDMDNQAAGIFQRDLLDMATYFEKIERTFATIEPKQEAAWIMRKLNFSMNERLKFIEYVKIIDRSFYLISLKKLDNVLGFTSEAFSFWSTVDLIYSTYSKNIMFNRSTPEQDSALKLFNHTIEIMTHRLAFS